MKINQRPQIDVNSISDQSAANVKASQKANSATSAFYKADKNQKSSAGRQMSESLKSTDSIKRDSYTRRMQTIKKTTGQLNEISKNASKEANKMMAQVLSPAGSKLHPRQLGNFIDQYA